ncbi:hypothetical protein SCLCIDRAFT_1223395 [Scleroderma citrinum Foug A]|uniref:Transmembrane protein n=1 Tax=Scleroderma citrinum Foug A TaxID=1036808 RepID=A0A0C2YT90_9AGAM|nr:hypothetical protein SCLCIDRAFT_1223395 [Scleroderma citrinum Foug A]
MFTSSRATRAPGFPMPANDPESLELATRAAAVEQPIPGHGASEDKTGDKGKSSAFPPSGSSDAEDIDNSSELLSAWMDRMQTLTVVTTFLVNMDSQLFSLTAIPTNLSINAKEIYQQLVYCCICGALIFHICAAITAYIASFALLRYRIVDASSGEGVPASQLNPWMIRNLRAQPTRKIVLEPVRPFEEMTAMLSFLGRIKATSSSRPPLSLLKRCYYTTLCQTAMGFILGLTGVLSYAWAGLSVPVGGFSAACLGVGVATGLWAITS